jgi:SAM-dependent methyltransferase
MAAIPQHRAVVRQTEGMSTSASDEEWAIRARSFGAVARDYDRARPSYADETIDDIVAAMPGREVVEVGAGTGKATVMFGPRGLHVTCVEPDAAMAVVLRENTASMPHVKVTVARFEDFNPGVRYDGLVGAQSWHWTDRATRYEKAAQLLRPGGLLALFWNREELDRTPLQPAFERVYAQHGLDFRKDPGGPGGPDWPRDELAQQTTFSDVEVRSYFSVQSYSAQQWCDYQASTSHHLILEPARRDALLADVAHVIEQELDGTFELPRRCDLYLARRVDS